MLHFYFPEVFVLMKDLKRSAVEMLREDEELKVLRVRHNCAVALDVVEGTVWICGKERKAVQDRIDEVLKTWAVQHWEMELEDYGVAMWFLGPKGSGEYAARIASESGAKVKVCPNNL